MYVYLTSVLFKEITETLQGLPRVILQVLELGRVGRFLELQLNH